MADNIFQQQITPEKPKILSQERIYVYVPKATNNTAGIASFPDSDFNVKDGVVTIKLNLQDFNRDTTGKIAINWPYAHNGSGTANTNGYGLIKIAGDSAGLLKYDDNGLLEVDNTKIQIDMADFLINQGFIKNTVDNLVNYYKKSETYNKTEVYNKEETININNLANYYTEDEVNTLIQDINAIQIRNINNEAINSTLANVQTVATQYIVDNYDRQPKNLDGLIITITDRENDKILFTYTEVSSQWINVGFNGVDLSNYYTKEETEEYVKNEYISGDNYIIVDDGEQGTEREGKKVIELDQTSIEHETPTEDSEKLITSGAVFNSIAASGAEKVIVELIRASQINGTLTQEQFNKLTTNDQNYIETSIDGHNEKYYFSTEASKSGFRVYTHIEHENMVTTIKIFTIIESVLSWGITEQVVGADGGIEEDFVIASNEWVALSDASPYTYGVTKTAQTTIGANSTVELINSQAVLFANYGFAIGNTNQQDITFYSIGTPSSNVTLTIKVGD